jgi:hypothetical protein
MLEILTEELSSELLEATQALGIFLLGSIRYQSTVRTWPRTFLEKIGPS